MFHYLKIIRRKNLKEKIPPTSSQKVYAESRNYAGLLYPI